jgi:hypothetical protein
MAPIGRVGAPSPRGLPLERDIHHLGGFLVCFFLLVFSVAFFGGAIVGCSVLPHILCFIAFFNPFIVAFRV